MIDALHIVLSKQNSGSTNFHRIKDHLMAHLGFDFTDSFVLITGHRRENLAIPLLIYVKQLWI